MKAFNIKFDGMLIATFLTTIFYSATYPFIHKEIMSTVSDSMVAITQIINCLSVVILGSIWNRNSDKLFKKYPTFCIVETISTILSATYVTISSNILAYYIIDTLLFSIITRNIVCGGIKLKVLRYSSEKEREHFDNNNNSVSAIATIIGSVIAMVLDLNFVIMLWLATFGNVVDNIFYIFIYFKTLKNKKN